MKAPSPYIGNWYTLQDASHLVSGLRVEKTCKSLRCLCLVSIYGKVRKQNLKAPDQTQREEVEIERIWLVRKCGQSVVRRKKERKESLLPMVFQFISMPYKVLLYWYFWFSWDILLSFHLIALVSISVSCYPWRTVVMDLSWWTERWGTTWQAAWAKLKGGRVWALIKKQ